MTHLPCPLQQVAALPALEHPKQPCHSLNHLCWLVSRKRRLLADRSGRKGRLGASRIPESHLTVSLVRRSRAVLKHQRERSSVCPVPLTTTGNCEAQVPSRRKWEQHAACALLATPAEASLAKSHVVASSMASSSKHWYRYCTGTVQYCTVPYYGSQISTTDRTHARTGPNTKRAQAHNHTQNSNSRTHPRQTSRTSHAHTYLPNYYGAGKKTPGGAGTHGRNTGP